MEIGFGESKKIPRFRIIHFLTEAPQDFLPKSPLKDVIKSLKNITL